MRVSDGESEHVLAQSNVWEMRSEKQMAALRMEGGSKGGGTSDDEPTFNIYHLCCLSVHPLFYTLSYTPPEKTWNGMHHNFCATDNECVQNIFSNTDTKNTILMVQIQALQSRC